MTNNADVSIDHTSAYYPACQVNLRMSDERDSRYQERDGGAVRDRSRSRDRNGGGGGGGNGAAMGTEDAKLFVGNLSFEARYFKL